MGSSFTIGRLRGIEIGINYTWLIALGLITWSLAAGFFPSQFPGWPSSTYWILALVSSLLLFACVLVHELAHSVVAQALGMRVQSINLFIFGGVSNIVGEAKRARDELYVSAAGPLSSVALALLFALAYFALRGINDQISALLFYLAGVNVLLAVFNLVPGFPLDGGRVFRALVWGVTGSFHKATRLASAVGKGFAYLLIFGGLFVAFSGEFLSGIWLAFIGWFLSEAADASYKQMTIQELLRGIHVAELMTKQPIAVQPDLTLREAVEQFVLRQNVRTLPVVEGDKLVGLLTLGEIRQFPPEQWGHVPVRDAMTPLERLHTVTPRDDVARALTAMGEEDINQVPVVDGGRLVGLLSRGNLIRFLRVRDELGVGSKA